MEGAFGHSPESPETAEEGSKRARWKPRPKEDAFGHSPESLETAEKGSKRARWNPRPKEPPPRWVTPLHHYTITPLHHYTTRPPSARMDAASL